MFYFQDLGNKFILSRNSLFLFHEYNILFLSLSRYKCAFLKVSFFLFYLFVLTTISFSFLESGTSLLWLTLIFLWCLLTLSYVLVLWCFRPPECKSICHSQHPVIRRRGGTQGLLDSDFSFNMIPSAFSPSGTPQISRLLRTLFFSALSKIYLSDIFRGFGAHAFWPVFNLPS